MHSVILYFGSFNPVHKGHMAVAEWILEQGLCNEVWFCLLYTSFIRSWPTRAAAAVR